MIELIIKCYEQAGIEFNREILDEYQQELEGATL